MEITVSSKDHHHQHLLHTATLPKKMSRQTYNVQTLQQQQQPYPPPRFTSCDISEQRDLDDPNGQIEAMWTNSSEKSPACSNAMPQEKCGVDQCLIQAGCSIGAQDNCTQHRQVSHDCILHNKSCWIQKSIHRRHSFNNPYHSGMQKESSV
ncbi:unnamed protein product [Meganyctiphanes norvegica]|uniref:Uncharacterized protein n=1 Tax=Meganyctiphanes norvegica TaxID=48144 RepID=A0AAV2Q3Q3_MEGNR